LRQVKSDEWVLAPSVTADGAHDDVIERLDFLAAREERTGTCAIRVSRHAGKKVIR
jgi:hypothetical protein